MDRTPPNASPRPAGPTETTNRSGGKSMSETTSRRGFLNAAGAAAVAGPASMALGAEPPPAYEGEIVDTHLHLWDLKILNLPWVASATGAARQILGHSYLL